VLSTLLPLALAGAAVHLFLIRAGLLSSATFRPGILSAVAVAILASFLASLLSGIDNKATALVLDHRLGLKEVMTTALEAGPRTNHPLLIEVRSRAATELRSGRFRQAFRITSVPAWYAALCATLLLASITFVPPFQPLAKETARTDVKTAGQKIQAAASRVSPETKKTDAFKRLETLARKMKQGEIRSAEQAFIDLDRIEKALRRTPRSSPPPEERKLFEALDSLAKEPLARELVDALGSRDQEALHKAVEEMSKAFSATEAESLQQSKERERLTERLTEVAKALNDAGRPDLARVFQKLATALKKGKVDEVKQFLASLEFKQATGELSQMCSGGAEAKSLAQAAELLQLARHILGAGPPLPLQTAQGSPSGIESSTSKGAGPLPGVGSTNLKGETYKSGDPVLRERQSSSRSLRTGEFESLYASEFQKAERWQNLKVEGKTLEEGETLREEIRGQGEKSTARTRLGAAPGSLPAGVEGASDLEKVPAGYRDLVKRYFDQGDKK
jgi:hypothetical protein